MAVVAAKTGGECSPALRRKADRVGLEKMVKGMLDGADVDIKPLKYELVIANPKDRDRGSVRIEYETGHVTWRRTVLSHWGPLQGYEYTDGDDGPLVSADRILATLGFTVAKGEPSG